MSTLPDQDHYATRSDLERAEERGMKIANDVESRAEHAIQALQASIVKEVRWLIIASIGFNQLFNNISLSNVATAGLAGAVLVVGKLVLVFFSAR